MLILLYNILLVLTIFSLAFQLRMSLCPPDLGAGTEDLPFSPNLEVRLMKEVTFATFSAWTLSMPCGCSSASTEHGGKPLHFLSREDVGPSSEEEETGSHTLTLAPEEAGALSPLPGPVLLLCSCLHCRWTSSRPGGLTQ